MSLLEKELPSFWPILSKLRFEEGGQYLPDSVNIIILRLLQMRNDIFRNAPKRRQSDYFLWEDPKKEHPTQCYPCLPLWRYPKKYRVSGQVDTDLCEKDFTSHNDFTHGMFNLGCCCEYNITFGFELMLHRESSQNLFRDHYKIMSSFFVLDLPLLT